MNKLLFSLLGIALPGLSATAQTMPPDTARTNRHTFGLTASPQLAHFFTANRSLPIGLLYKRQLTPTKALRLRLVGRYQNTDSTNYAGVLAGTGTQAWQVMGYVGYEWQRPLSRRFGLYYGVEVGGGLGRNVRRSVRDWYNDQGPFNEDVSYTIKTWQVQARPFVGVNFRLNSRASLYAEAAVPIAYAHQSEGYVGYFNQGAFTSPGNFTHNIYSGETTSGTLKIVLLPVELMGFSYMF